MEGNLPYPEHGEHELAVKHGCTVVIIRVIAISKCPVGVLIYASIVQAVSIAKVRVQCQAVVRADAVRHKTSVVVRASHARPVKEVRELRRRLSSGAQLKRRLNTVEDVPCLLVCKGRRETVHHASSTTSEGPAAELRASGECGLKEGLRRRRRTRLLRLRHGIEGLRESLPAGGHEEWHLIKVDSHVDVFRSMANVADLDSTVARHLPLNREIPLVVRAGSPLGVLQEGVGHEGYVSACRRDAARSARHDWSRKS